MVCPVTASLRDLKPYTGSVEALDPRNTKLRSAGYLPTAASEPAAIALAETSVDRA